MTQLDPHINAQLQPEYERLYDALLDQDSDTVERMLRGQPDLARAWEVGTDGEYSDDAEDTLLHSAVQQGWLEGIRLLVQYGADLNEKYDNDERPLHLALKLGEGSFEHEWAERLRRDVTALLLELGADPNAQDEYGRSPLHYAESCDLTRLLLRYGADPSLPDYQGQQPLHRSNVSIRTIASLLAAGASVNARDMYQRTPLHMQAWWGGILPALCYLIRRGADVNAQDDMGRTPLFYTIRAHFDYGAQYVPHLVACGAGINARDHAGRTALHTAVWEHAEEVTEALIAAGADVNARDNEGRTPLDMTERRLEDEGWTAEEGEYSYDRWQERAYNEGAEMSEEGYFEEGRARVTKLLRAAGARHSSQ